MTDLTLGERVEETVLANDIPVLDSRIRLIRPGS
jgi:hypothetical protein